MIGLLRFKQDGVDSSTKSQYLSVFKFHVLTRYYTEAKLFLYESLSIIIDIVMSGSVSPNTILIIRAVKNNFRKPSGGCITG